MQSRAAAAALAGGCNERRVGMVSWAHIAAKLSAATVIAAFSLTGCSSAGVADKPPAKAPSATSSVECVDSSGPNSSPDQIVDAALGAPATNLRGETRTVAQTLPPYMSSPRLRQDAIEGVFRDVPEGGDAAYAAAVCSLTNWDIKNGSYIHNYGVDITSDEVRAALARQPSLLRGWGRAECAAANADIARWTMQSRYAEQELAKARANPEAYKQSLIDQAQYVLTPDPAISDPTNTDTLAIEVAQASVNELPRTSARDLVARLEVGIKISDLALDHQCPQLKARPN